MNGIWIRNEDGVSLVLASSLRKGNYGLFANGAPYSLARYQRIPVGDVQDTESDVEVIGNIYEHPELLGESQ